MLPQNLGSLFRQTVARCGEKKALLFKIADSYQSISWAQVNEKVKSVSLSLMAMGLRPGDRIAILSENRPEWLVIDIAAQSIGLVTVPIYTSLAPAEIEYILNDSEASVIAVSSKNLFEKIPPIALKLKHLKHVIGFDAALSLFASSITFPLILFKDMEKMSTVGADFSDLCEKISPDSIASIIYTSGTTGSPKGVMLTHSNFIHNVVYSKETLRMGDDELHLSFLPLSHVFERMAGHYLMIYIGATIAYAESMDTVSQNILEVRPTFLLGVPRFYEKVMNRVLDNVKKSGPFRKGLFFWGKDLGEARRKGTPKSGLFSALEVKLSEKLIYHKFRQRLGGRVRFCISGGAPIAKDIVEFFSDLGVMIYEGYGLTETSPVMTVNREDRWRIGSVGQPLSGVEVKIAADGEIITKSPCVMKGYFGKPEDTTAAIQGGWFHTGDLGKIDPEGYLFITGRKKEIIVTSGGKKIAPKIMEELLEKDPFVLRCVLYGEGRKCITALIVPCKEELERYAQDHRIQSANYEILIKQSAIHQMMDGRIQKYMEDFASYERIKYFALLPRDFSMEAGELTPTLKIKRDVILRRYQELLLPFYQQSSDKD